MLQEKKIQRKDLYAQKIKQNQQHLTSSLGDVCVISGIDWSLEVGEDSEEDRSPRISRLFFP